MLFAACVLIFFNMAADQIRRASGHNWGEAASVASGADLISTYAALDEKIVALAPKAGKVPLTEAAVMPLVSLSALDALRFTGAPWPARKSRS